MGERPPKERITVTTHPFHLRSFSFAVLAFAACSVVLFGVWPATAQTPTQTRTEKNFVPEMDISLGVSGQLTYTRTPTTNDVQPIGDLTTQTTQGTSPSPGVLGTFHQSFRPWLGYNVNVGYTGFSEEYSHDSVFIPATGSTVPPTSASAQGSIGTSAYELTIAETFEGPRSKRFNTFGQFGGGGLFFLPTAGVPSAKNETRPAMMFGVGMNYKLTSHLDLRAEYRGLFYKSPDFNLRPYNGDNFPITRLFTVTSQPAISVVYTFGRKPKRKVLAKLR
jgi:opacity protein-like surface antigen